MSGYFVNLVFRSGVAIFFVLCPLSTVFAAETSNDALQFDIAVVQGAERYLELLEYPAYLVVALENNGIKPSNAGHASLTDERTIQLKNAMLRYVEKRGSVYAYQSSLEWDMPLKHLKFELPMEIDTSSVPKGHMLVRVYLPLAKLFPDALTERIRMKVQALSGPDIQKEMLSYFDDLARKSPAGSGVQGMFSQIMLQSYNVPSDMGEICPPREPGDAESLSDQAYLLATLVIWLVIVPIFIMTFILLRRRKARKVATGD